MSTEIDGFKTTTDSLITTKTTPRSITPANVGGQINALADIVEAFRLGHVAGIATAQAAAEAAQADADTILALIGDGTDVDSTVNKLGEALAILSNFSEGADVAGMINNKVDKVTGKSLLADTEITRLLTLGNYTHPTTDGYLHVPATSTTNNGKFLMAGATAGAISWVSLAMANISDLATALAAKADLVGGKLPVSQLPDTIPLDNLEDDPLEEYFGPGIVSYDTGVDDGTGTSTNIFKLKVDEEYLWLKAQQLWVNKRFGLWYGRHGDAAMGVTNTASPTSSGGTLTSVARELAGLAGTFLGRVPKIEFPAAATTANAAGNVRDIKKTFAVEDGFSGEMIYVPNDDATIADLRVFNGFTTATAGHSSTVQPSALTESMIGWGNDSSDTNIQLFTGPSGSITKTDLGSGFPKNTTDIIQWVYKVAPGGNLTCRFYRRSRTDGSILATSAAITIANANLPVDTVGMGRQMYRNNGSTTGILWKFYVVHWSFYSETNFFALD